MKQVVFVTRILVHYRVPFHEGVRSRLASRGICYRVIYGKPTPSEAKKGDLADLPWGELVFNCYLGFQGLVWQRLPSTKNVDLLILGHENKHLHNYVLQVRRWFGGTKLAFFGHGRNFQAKRASSASERFKRFWLRHVDWWFAYTQRSADFVEQSGFPKNCITVFNNAIDASQIGAELKSIPIAERDEVRDDLFGGSKNIGVFIGGVYEMKRIAFLLEVATAIRIQVPDFRLLIIGGGDQEERVHEAARMHSWIHALGPKFGREKTLLASLGSVFLMPGLVGLSILDAFAYGLPIVTTAVPYHSPEIDYLKHGKNGVIVEDTNNVGTYAHEVVRLLTDKNWNRQLCLGGQADLEKYTVEAMADRFSEGIIRAIEL